ncbi:MAG TPA: HAMP domain-containing sensor histidine kinase [Bryobacteraceae bacterium]|jgi:signal transduction histidine kinase|nr:HAMP domain-containing sensor histidine kinase [Bryobacteraceae bacterium]
MTLTQVRDQILIAWLLAAAAAAALLWRPLPHEWDMTGLAFVVLAATALVRFEPKHTLALGLTVLGMYFLSSAAVDNWRFPAITPHRDSHLLFIVILTAFATFITASNAANRRREQQAAADAVRTAEALTGAQLRAQLAETAISIGKLAAALSHEINSPLGVLRSGIETLEAIERSPEKHERMAAVREELFHSVLQSAGRIEEVTQRLRRFVSLEDAELKAADLNELLTGVKWMLDSTIAQRNVRVDLDLERSLPALTCRPQLLTTAFSSMLSNALNAVNGDGRVDISTRLLERDVEITIRDNGKGMTAEEADTIFEPQFKVDGTRVASGNWSLFNARQIVYEHGGSISLDTAPGSGTAVHVLLPIRA